MATILEFRRVEGETARKGDPATGALGEIVIFPGVRIEHHTPTDAPRPVQSTQRRRATGSRKKSRV